MRGVGLFNAKDNEGKTPAHHAAENGHADSLRVVHNGGGNLSAVDETGCCPSHYAVNTQHLAHTYTQTHLHKPHPPCLPFARPPSLSLCMSLCLRVYMFGCWDWKGLNSPTKQAMNGHESCMVVIVDVNADFRSKNAFGFTPLRLALRNKHANCASFIRSSIRRYDQNSGI